MLESQKRYIRKQTIGIDDNETGIHESQTPYRNSNEYINQIKLNYKMIPTSRFIAHFSDLAAKLRNTH